MVKGYKDKEDGERLKGKGETEASFTPSSLNSYLWTYAQVLQKV